METGLFTQYFNDTSSLSSSSTILAQQLEPQRFQQQQQQQQQQTAHAMFDPLYEFAELSDDKMDKHLNQQQFNDMTPWRALTKVIGIPTLMLAFIVAVKMNFFLKIILLLMILIHIIVATCFISFLSKTNFSPDTKTPSSSSSSKPTTTTTTTVPIYTVSQESY